MHQIWEANILNLGLENNSNDQVITKISAVLICWLSNYCSSTETHCVQSMQITYAPSAEASTNSVAAATYWRTVWDSGSHINAEMRAIREPNNPCPPPKCWCTRFAPFTWLFIPQAGQHWGFKERRRKNYAEAVATENSNGDTGDTAMCCQSILLSGLILKKRGKKQLRLSGIHRTVTGAQSYGTVLHILTFIWEKINPDFIFPPLIFLSWYYTTTITTTTQSHSQSSSVDLSTGGPT